MNSFRFLRTIPFVVLGLALPLIVGCGESTGSVRGKVYFQDKAMTGGSVAFVPKNEKVATANIQADGSYEVKVTTGVAKISVSAPLKINVPKGMLMDPAKMGATDKAGPVAAPSPGKVTPIPDRYGDADKSGLAYEVKSGNQEHDIKLLP